MEDYEDRDDIWKGGRGGCLVGVGNHIIARNMPTMYYPCDLGEKGVCP